jgi:hypothetical protein
MPRWQSGLALFAAALWWGSLTALGAWVVPTLFAKLETARLAGATAAHLFSAQARASAACAVLLLVLLKPRRFDASEDGLPANSAEEAAPDATPWIIAGLFVALLIEFAVAPRIALRAQLPVWHSVATGLLLVQWACACRTLWCTAVQMSQRR